MAAVAMDNLKSVHEYGGEALPAARRQEARKAEGYFGRPAWSGVDNIGKRKTGPLTRGLQAVSGALGGSTPSRNISGWEVHTMPRCPVAQFY